MQFYARDIMSDHPIMARPEMTSEELVELLVSNSIGGAPVVNQEGILIGVISLMDVLKNGGIMDLWATGYFNASHAETVLDEAGFQIEAITTGFVSDCMTYKVHTAYPDTTVEELARVMFEQQIHRLIIVNHHEDRPVGIVSTFDLLKLMAAKDATHPGVAGARFHT